MIIESIDNDDRLTVVIALDSIILSADTNGILWLSRHDGEGMELGEKELDTLLSDYYNGNF